MHFQPISADLAINLFEALSSARRLQLHPALSEAVRQVGVAVIDHELQRLVPARSLNHVASLGLRGERVFPVPSIITHVPPLIGYYRMLLGLSKKEFGDRLRYRAWVKAEEDARLSPILSQALDEFCRMLIVPLAELADAMGTFDDRDLSDLALLTLGPTLQGGRNNIIGSRAAAEVFQALRHLLSPWLTLDQPRLLHVALSTGAIFEAIVASDPDIRINIGMGARAAPLLAIEIKGGSDTSNAHNRAGESEKSHIKATIAGYQHRWTIIRMGRLDRQAIKAETPSSTDIFEADDLIRESGPDWQRFRRQLGVLLGERL